MLKITQVKDNGHIVLRLEGKLIGEWVRVFRKVSGDLMAKQLYLIVDLEHVSFVDAGGAQALKGLPQENCKLVNCSPFIRELLKLEQ